MRRGCWCANRGRGTRRGARCRSGCPDEFGGAINSDQHPPRGGGAAPLALLPIAAERVRGPGTPRRGDAGPRRAHERCGHAAAHRPSRDLIAGTASADGGAWALTLGTIHAARGSLRARRRDRHAHPAVRRRTRTCSRSCALGEVEEFWYPSFDGHARSRRGWSSRPDFDPAKQVSAGARDPRRPAHAPTGSASSTSSTSLAGAGYAGAATPTRAAARRYGEDVRRTCIQYRFPGDDARDLHGRGRGGGGARVRGREAHRRHRRERRRAASPTGSSRRPIASRPRSPSAASPTGRRSTTAADFAMFTPFWFRKPPFEDPQEYLERSPVDVRDRASPRRS